jgi:hypothetical protein
MQDKMIEIVKTLGYEVFLQGSMSEDIVYPDTFFTYWNNSAYGAMFYDNDENSVVWDFDLNIYSNNPSLVNSLLLEAKVLLKENEFIVTGKGRSLPTDQPSHTGRGITVLFIETPEKTVSVSTIGTGIIGTSTLS